MAGKTDEHAAPEDLSCPVDREAVQPQMDTVRFNGKGDIDTVVYDESGSVFCRQLAQVIGEFVEFSAGEILFAKLYTPYSAFESIFDDIDKSQASGLIAGQ